MRIRNTLLALTLALSTTTHAHHKLSVREIAEHQAISKRCAVAAGAFTMERKKRSLTKRNTLLSRDTNVTIHIESPHYSTVQNDTCVLVPDIGAGPYVWPRSQTLRQDMREGQAGIPIYLDIGVLDVDTCTPAPNVLIDLWHCNATGSYSSFEALSPNTPFGDIMNQLNLTMNSAMDVHTGDSTWLRGMWPTDSNGVLEMVTIFPGFYVQRSIHIHVLAHTNWTIRSNGTIFASNVASSGQLFFDEQLSKQIMAMEPYSSHTEIERVTNDADALYAEEVGTGWYPVFQVEPLDGVDVANGMVGYVTLGVNITATTLSGEPFGTPSNSFPAAASD